MTSPRVALASLLAVALAAPPSAPALILYGQDNAANQSAPGGGVPWASVAKVGLAGGGTNGTAVYLGNQYMLTANHVGLATNVTFDGVTNVARDASFTPVQIGGPDVDLKVFRLAADPGVPAVQLDSRALSALDDGGVNPTTLVAWGRGRNPLDPLNDSSVRWGDDTTIAKRWGTNTILGTEPLSYPGSGFDYNYVAAVAVSGDSVGETGFAYYDSGGAAFQSVAGTWYLVGIATNVETTSEAGATAVAFANDQLTGPIGVRGSRNWLVPISPYRNDLAAYVPEPGSSPMLFGVAALGAALLALAWRRRGRQAVRGAARAG